MIRVAIVDDHPVVRQGIIGAHLGPENDRPLREHLSDREYQVLRMIARGKATREISSKSRPTRSGTISPTDPTIRRSTHATNCGTVSIG